MIEMLQNSRIIKVESYSNENGQFKILPLFGFSTEKLQNIPIDLCSKFNL